MSQPWHRRIYYGDGQIYTRIPGTGQVYPIADLAISDDTDQIGKEIVGVWNAVIAIDPDNPVATARTLRMALNPCAQLKNG